MAPPVDVAAETAFAEVPSHTARARNVGILAMEMYVPSTYVDLADLGKPSRGATSPTSIRPAPPPPGPGRP